MSATRSLRYAVCVTSALLLAQAPSALGGGEDEHPAWLAKIQILARKQGFEADPALVRAETLESPLPVHAVVAEIVGVAPPPQFVVLESGSDWHVVVAQKTVVEGWRAAMTVALASVPEDIQPSVLAEGVTRLLVDPDPRFGHVVSSWADIPLHDELSDVYRDAERRGNSSSLAEAIEGAKKKHGPLAAPSARHLGKETEFVFYTWHFFGGEVIVWRLLLGSSQPSISRRVLAAEMGSYKHYY